MNCKNVSNYIIGRNTIHELGNILIEKRINSKSIIVFIIDQFFKDNEKVKHLPIEKNDIVVFASTENEPHADYINLISSKIKDKLVGGLPVAIIGMGGGTTMDIAKAISILLTNPGKAEEYQGWDLVKNPGVYKIGIPTISGTGAEATRTAVMTSKNLKLGINSDYSVFDQIIMDSSLLETVPKDQFMYTAMDCYVHCVESLRGNTNDAMTIAYAEKSLELIREVFLREMDYDKLMVASYLGGSAVANSNVGICHPLAYGLTTVLDIHHGESICMIFNHLEEYYPEVTEFRDIMENQKVVIPKDIMKNINDYEIEKMINATRKGEKPLTNAFGKNWKKIFSKEKMEEIFLKL